MSVNELIKISTEMQKLTIEYEYEEDHLNADSLLIRTIKELTTRETQEVVTEILQQYSHVKKHYA